MVWDIIIVTIGVLALIEGILLFTFTKKFTKIIKELSKKDKLKQIALIEIIIGFILTILALFLLFY